MTQLEHVTVAEKQIEYFIRFLDAYYLSDI